MTGLDRASVDAWLGAYVEAWKSYDREQIRALFSDDVSYRYHPDDDPIEGSDSVVESWLGEGEHTGASTPDRPGTFDAEYRTIAVEGDVAVAIGRSEYFTKPGGPLEKVFDNCFVLRFDPDGRCAEFTEWFMERKEER